MAWTHERTSWPLGTLNVWEDPVLLIKAFLPLGKITKSSYLRWEKNHKKYLFSVFRGQ